MRQLSPTSKVLLERELALFRRENSEIWQCRYKVDGKWLRASTKEYDLDKAKVKAKRLMIEAEIRKSNNLPVVTRRFRDIAKVTLAKLKEAAEKSGNKSEVRKYSDYKIVIENYLIKFLGNRLITTIDYDALNYLEAKRIEAMGKVPTRSTMLTHNAALKRVFKQAEYMGYITEANIPELEAKGASSKKRPAFTVDETRALLARFESWIIQTHNKQSLLMRELMFDYINVLLDTGARPGKELLNLRWQQVRPTTAPKLIKTAERFEEGMAGEDTQVAISKLNRSVLMTVNGKTGERDIVGMTRTVEALARIAKRNYQVQTPLLTPLINVAKVTNTDYVFVTSNGGRPTNFNNIFDKFLAEHNLAIDPITNQKRVLYSLRHTYATLALTYDKVPIHTLTKQMGTSVAMVEKHYSHLKVIQAIEQLRGEESRQLINAGGVIDEMYESNKVKLDDQ